MAITSPPRRGRIGAETGDEVVPARDVVTALLVALGDVQALASQPVSVMRRSVDRSPRAVSSKVTRSELSPRVSPSGYTQRNEKSCDGTASTTVISGMWASGDDGSPNTRRPTDPGVGSRWASSGHHSFRCLGCVMTSNTVAGDAAISISRSIFPYPSDVASHATIGCV